MNEAGSQTTRPGGGITDVCFLPPWGLASGSDSDNALLVKGEDAGEVSGPGGSQS